MKYQLWSRDEYGQNSIVASSPDAEKLSQRAQQEVTKINVDNSLSVDEKKRNWEAYFVELIDENGDPIEDAVYGGLDSMGRHCVTTSEPGLKSVPIEHTNAKVRVFCGVLDGEKWYGHNDRNKPIDSLKDGALLGKTSYFIKRVD